MLPFLVACAIAAFAAALALMLLGAATPAAVAHVVFAAGVLPLIFGAMTHFVPVLTRGRAAGRAVQALPLGLLAAGLVAVTAFLLPAFFLFGSHLAALAGLTLSLLMAGWIVHRARAALGAPHPCLHWYLAAVLCLALALAAVLAMPLLPGQRAALRLFHLHLNTLGFIGLTALGTLAVLVPTALGRPDPEAAGRLRRDLLPAAAGVLLVAAGAAWWMPAALGGALLLLLPLVRLGTAWVVRFAHEILCPHGAAASLALALGGFTLLLLAGVLHGAGRLQGGEAVAGFVLAFLLPLVIGAASQLLPVWLRPGVQTEWHRAVHESLGRFAVLRGLTFLIAGLGVTLGVPAAAWLAAAGLAMFVLQVLRALLRR
jgi:hypothetical protein